MAKRSSKTKQAIATLEPIEPVIRVIRGLRVIVDLDLARIYGVTTKRLNEQVKRNLQRFPGDFMFRLIREEVESVVRSRSQFATLDSSENQSQSVTG